MDRDWSQHDWGNHPLWKSLLSRRATSIVVAMTHDPAWLETLESIREQDEEDFSCLVVGDCPLPEMWEYARRSADARFAFLFAPGLQGLARVWNYGLSDPTGSMIVLMGAENPLPSSYLSTCREALRRRPRLGYVTVSVAGQADHGLGWLFAITRECADAVGPLDYSYGPGGLGTIVDWRIRVERAGFTPRRLPIQVAHRGYSIMDQVADWGMIERLDVLRKRWGESQIPVDGTAWELPVYE